MVLAAQSIGVGSSDVDILLGLLRFSASKVFHQSFNIIEFEIGKYIYNVMLQCPNESLDEEIQLALDEDFMSGRRCHKMRKGESLDNKEG